ncbi:MAG: ABC-F family ATP-binding cassette domain-containing protein [Candidatus Cloacimonas sp.]|nr:ABC-F family ATP-binding cassette domain-containing protein [Candidatus Cloacimonas sp.]MDD2250300.1 ABC-F family ATP-binding cassette domain-containing protein [Candidatus Cloacimonadota bacterium]
MSLIQVINASIEFGGNYILSDINCTLEHNSKIGLIGSNGSGKTTLIKLMLGVLLPSEGKVLHSKKCRIAYLPQNPVLDGNISFINYVHSSRPDILKLQKKINELSELLQDNHSEENETELNDALEKYQAIGGDEFENDLKFIITSLGFTEDDYPKSLNLFSGGEQSRICLARILMMSNDLLILDEPTNHLDVAMISWLEKYLNASNIPFLVVSHDRTFLDNTVSVIFHLENKHLSITKGNYSSFEQAKAIELKTQERQYARQQKFIAETEDFISRNIAGQKTTQAKSRLKLLSRMEVIQNPQQQKKIKLNIQSTGRSGNDVYTLKDVELGIFENAPLAKNVNLEVHYRDRICIVGPNGCGKTTLLKILMEEKDIFSGSLKIGASLEIGYYDQHQVLLDEELTVMDTLWQLVPNETRGYVLSFLARFGFRGDDVDKKVCVLSGGEKSRLMLCTLIHQTPNLLILDEPTNHLDIAMNNSLLSALQEYRGTIVFVSHDRYFMKQLATKYWVFHKALENDLLYPTISEVDMGLEQALELAFSIPELPKKAPVLRERKKKINPWHLEQIHKQIEQEQATIEESNIKIENINSELALSSTYSNELRAKELCQQIELLLSNINKSKQRIAELENKYLELSYDS